MSSSIIYAITQNIQTACILQSDLGNYDLERTEALNNAQSKNMFILL